MDDRSEVAEPAFGDPNVAVTAALPVELVEHLPYSAAFGWASGACLTYARIRGSQVRLADVLVVVHRPAERDPRPQILKLDKQVKREGPPTRRRSVGAVRALEPILVGTADFV